MIGLEPVTLNLILTSNSKCAGLRNVTIAFVIVPDGSTEVLLAHRTPYPNA